MSSNRWLRGLWSYGVVTAVVTALILLLPIGSFGLARAVKGILWEREVGGHLKRAADANSVELAKQELAVVVKYLDDNNITSGYTSVLWTTPDEDVGFWHTNIKTCLTQLEQLPSAATQSEKDMVLLKLRQTLLDHVAGHEHVTQPAGISIFPHNTLYYVWCVIGILCAIVALLPVACVISELD